MARNVKLNGKGFREILNSDEVRDELTKRAERVLSQAQANAPVASGEYRDSLHIEQATTDRAVVRVKADVSHAWVVEARDGVLAKALDAAGGD